MTHEQDADASAAPPGKDGAWRSQNPLVDELADEIRVGVMTGRFPIGSYLRQSTLAAEFGVSRTPVREALRKLQPEGLIQVIPNRGALVRGPTPRDIREAYVVRAELEGLAAKLAVEWISDQELARLCEAEELFSRLVDEPGAEAGSPGTRGDDHDRAVKWTRANDMFHEVVQQAARNERLHQTILLLHRSIPRNLTAMALSGDPRLLRRNVAEHALIVQAIKDHDGAAARQAMTDHVLKSGEIVATWFELRTRSLGEGA